ncbi:hypothetical protein EDD86DRAFT_244889 [Gorgonomyces haynaldii]|nr:hypothetical protein EDD86DRAFT_244889 [Gorgonomyces haynaldii]
MDELQLVIRQQPKKGRMTGFSDDIRKLYSALIPFRHRDRALSLRSLFFLYPDIGIRSPGKYRFQCDLDVRSTEPITTITSQDLKIHSPKNYLKPAGLESDDSCHQTGQASQGTRRRP